MKGDSIKVICNDGNGPFEMTAEKNGSAVEWAIETENKIQWVTVSQLSKAQKAVRTMKFKAEVVSAVVEEPAKPV